MIRVTVQLYEEQFDAVRERARLDGLSLAGYVRHALDIQVARSESLVRLVRRRALAVVDDVEPGPGTTPGPAPDPAFDMAAGAGFDMAAGAGFDTAAGPAPGNNAQRGSDPGERRAPRYWLDNPRDDE